MKKGVSQIVISLLFILFGLGFLVVMYNIVKDTHEEEKEVHYKLFKKQLNKLKNINSIVIVNNNGEKSYSQFIKYLNDNGVSYSTFSVQDINSIPYTDVIIYFAPAPSYILEGVSKVKVIPFNNKEVKKYEGLSQIYTPTNDIVNSEYVTLKSNRFFLNYFRSDKTEITSVLVTNLLNKPGSYRICNGNKREITIRVDGSEIPLSPRECKEITGDIISSEDFFVVNFLDDSSRSEIILNPLDLKGIEVKVHEGQLCSLEEPSKVKYNNILYNLKEGDCINVGDGYVEIIEGKRFFLYKNKVFYPSHNFVYLKKHLVDNIRVDVFNPKKETSIEVIRGDKYYIEEINALEEKVLNLSLDELPIKIFTKLFKVVSDNEDRYDYVDYPKLKDFYSEATLNLLAKKTKKLIIIGPSIVPYTSLMKKVQYYYFLPLTSVNLQSSNSKVFVEGYNLVPIFQGEGIYFYKNRNIISSIALGGTKIIYVPYSIFNEELVMSLI